MDFMKFITDNYVWFIVGGVVTLMALIGYVAERTDFGRKESEKKEKKANNDKNRSNNVAQSAAPVAPIPEQPVIPDADNLVLGQDSTTVPVVEEGNNTVPNTMNGGEDLTVPLGATSESAPVTQPTAEEDLTVPLESNDDVVAPIVDDQNQNIYGDMENDEIKPVETTSLEDNEPNNNLFNDEPTGVNEVVAEEPQDQLQPEPNGEEVPANNKKTNMDLPNIDNLKDNNAEEEDVWKF